MAYTCPVRRRFSHWRSTGRFGGTHGEDRLELLAARQVVVPHRLPAPDICKGGMNPVDRDAVHLCPGEPVDGQLQRICRLLATGLPVDDLEAAVVGLVHRIYSPAHHMPGEQQLE